MSAHSPHDRRKRIIVRLALLFWVGAAFGGAGIGWSFEPQNPPVRPAANQALPQTLLPPPEKSEPKKSKVDYLGDVSRQVRGDSAIYIVGNVAFHHNGTFMECDSVVRHNESWLEGFGKVVIKKDTTFIYADHVSYDGNTNIAKIYSPLIKLVNGDAVGWIYNYMEFNTLTSVGEYNQAGVITQRDNLMESDSGIYYGSTNQIKFMGRVSMRNDNYKIRTDSVAYHLDHEVVTFLTRTYVWDKDRDFFMADRGEYIRSTETYHFTLRPYALTPDQEYWSDTMNYESRMKQVTMRGNLQMLDTVNKTLAFGDYGYYNDSLKSGLLTRNPSIIAYEQPDSTGQEADSSFMRADAFYFDSYPPGKSKPDAVVSDLPAVSKERGDGLEQELPPSSLPAKTDPLSDDLVPQAMMAPDEIQPPKENRSEARSRRRQAKENVAPPVRDTLLSVVAAPTAPEAAPVAVDSIPAAFAGRDSVGTHVPDSLLVSDSSLRKGALSDTVLRTKQEPLPADSARKDTLERVVRAFHHVKLYRKDAQAIADSMISFSVDSTSSFFGRPMLWSGQNQLTADRIDLYTRNEKLDYADFIGSPFTTQQVREGDSVHFNQAQSRFMKAWFANNEIVRAQLSGNVLNHYYMEEKRHLDKFAVLSSATLTIRFANREPSRFAWQGDVNYTIYPINKIPEEQSERLPNFVWTPQLRPQNRYEITTRTIRPSERAVAIEYAKPEFPIDERTRLYREELLKGGTWHDRNDQLKFSIADFEERKLPF